MADIIKYAYIISFFIGILVVPFLLIKALILNGQSDPEQKAQGRHLIMVTFQFIIVLAVLPALIAVLWKILPKVDGSFTTGESNSEVPLYHAATPGWVFSMIISILSSIFVGIFAVIKQIAATIAIPLISILEGFDKGQISSTIVTLEALDKVWTFFMMISVLLIIIGFLYNFARDIMKESVGEPSTSRDGTGIISYLGRALVSLIAAFITYPAGKVLLWFNGVFVDFIMSKVSVPNLVFIGADLPSDSFMSFSNFNPIAKSIGYMTLAPFTTNFAKAIGLNPINTTAVAIIDLKQIFLIGAFNSYAIFFLLSIGLYFAMRIVMIVFWFGFAPVIFSVGIGYKGKINAVSAWVSNFFTWAFFPSVVALMIYITFAITDTLRKINLGQGAGQPLSAVLIAFLIYFASLTLILRAPSMLRQVFTHFGEDISGGTFMQAILRRAKL